MEEEEEGWGRVEDEDSRSDVIAIMVYMSR